MRGLYGLPNFRDIGGLTASDGVMLKTGVLYRSAELAKLADADRTTLRASGIGLICDLRSSGRSRRKPADLAPDHGMRIFNVPVLDSPEWEPSLRKIFQFLLRRDGMERFDAFNRDFYHHFAFQQSARVGEVLRLLADDSHGPALFHCQAGRDRTGIIAALIQLLAGVPYDVVRADYLRSNDCFEPRLDEFIRGMRRLTLYRASHERLRWVLTARGETLDEMFETLHTRYGSVERYAGEACGLDDQTVAALRRRLRG